MSLLSYFSFFLLAAAWIGPGQIAFQSAKQSNGHNQKLIKYIEQVDKHAKPGRKTITKNFHAISGVFFHTFWNSNICCQIIQKLACTSIFSRMSLFSSVENKVNARLYFFSFHVVCNGSSGFCLVLIYFEFKYWEYFFLLSWFPIWKMRVLYTRQLLLWWMHELKKTSNSKFDGWISNALNSFVKSSRPWELLWVVFWRGN